FEQFEVPVHKEWVVLDALNYIKDRVDGSLTYRWSCRMGICGSCGMMVNGEPKLSCATFLSSYSRNGNKLRIEPLRYFPVIRNLGLHLRRGVYARLPKACGSGGRDSAVQAEGGARLGQVSPLRH